MHQLDMEQENVINQANEKFKYKEPIVLVSIICLSLLRGFISTVDQTRFFAHARDEYSWGSGQMYQYYSILSIFGLVPGIFLVPFISDVCGRKPAVILLISLCLLSSIISSVPFQLSLAIAGNFIVAVMKGGVRTITTLAICEYCGPKHRFSYLVADETVKLLSVKVISLLYTAKVFNEKSPYISLVAIVLTLACMATVWWWPESPYWLASQGRVEDSRRALLWLRAEGGAARAELETLESPHQRSSLKLFWLSLLVAILSVTVAKCSSSAESILYTLANDSFDRQSSHTVMAICGNVAISCLLVLISYYMKRKTVYLIAAVIPLVFVLILSIWVYTGKYYTQGFAFFVTVLICNILIECGPYALSFALLIEAIPQKYYTYISCVCSLCFNLSNLYFPVLSLQHRFSFPLYISLWLFTVPALVLVMLFFWLVPEPRDKNLLQIEKQYLGQHSQYMVASISGSFFFVCLRAFF